MAEDSKVQLNWYVLKAIGGRERKVSQSLQDEIARLHLESFVPSVLVPTEKVYQIRNGKKVSKERVFFPGYIFVEALLDGEIPHILRNIPDVLGFLNNPAGEPAPLQQSEVNRLLGKIDELEDEDEMYTVPFAPGDSVRVIDGAFKTFTGVVDEVNEEKRRLVVLVKIFERKTPLELSFMQVEKE